MTTFMLIHTTLTSKRLPMDHEATLQNEIERTLHCAGIPAIREYSLGKGSRIDFLCQDGVGIELKLRGTAMSIAKQLKRYEKSDEIKSLILVTGKNVDPKPLGFSKPISTIWLAKAWL